MPSLDKKDLEQIKEMIIEDEIVDQEMRIEKLEAGVKELRELLAVK